MKRLCYVLVICLMFVGATAYADSAAVEASKLDVILDDTLNNVKEPFFDSISFGFQFGKDQLLPDDLKGKHSRNTVYRFLLQGENKTLLPNPYSLVFEGHYSKHKANEKPDNNQDTWMQEAGANVWLKRNFFKERWYEFYCMVGGGFSYVLEFPEFENRDWDKKHLKSDIARSGFLGTFGGAVGKEFGIPYLDDHWVATTELRLTHQSDPFGPDFGKNYGTAQLMVGYRF